MKAAICAAQGCQTGKRDIEDFFIATIDGQPFEATQVLGYSSFGVNIVLGVITTERGRRYISFAADDDITEGQNVVSLEGKITIGYLIEEGENIEYPADLGGAEVYVAADKPYAGRFIANLVQGSAYATITRASFSVKGLCSLSQA
ncbi:hypothetical protein IAE35_13135 [Pseudomonas sp. S75]|uniref:hypothetical protein n=1 Tax=unclassified Pseudomonas TaxID=196821 RepID=UPI001906B8AE|nr:MULTISPECIES: hypothetical protein [unclassified Pseudomonas]MBJ9974404.1 hypothetical protein [Pseudomonas sp. S30]MBK0154287.1 hypothetical protein [Pseudomonas sp. S75]